MGSGLVTVRRNQYALRWRFSNSRNSRSQKSTKTLELENDNRKWLIFSSEENSGHQSIIYLPFPKVFWALELMEFLLSFRDPNIYKQNSKARGKYETFPNVITMISNTILLPIIDDGIIDYFNTSWMIEYTIDYPRYITHWMGVSTGLGGSTCSTPKWIIFRDEPRGFCSRQKASDFVWDGKGGSNQSLIGT